MSVSSHHIEFFEEEMKDALYRTTGRWSLSLEDLPRENLCDAVANEFAVMIEDEFDYTVKSPVKAPVNGAKHFIAVVTATPNGELDTPVIVDGTIKQFDSSYPEILIAPLTEDTVTEIYDAVKMETA